MQFGKTLACGEYLKQKVQSHLIPHFLQQIFKQASYKGGAEMLITTIILICFFFFILGFIIGFLSKGVKV